MRHCSDAHQQQSKRLRYSATKPTILKSVTFLFCRWFSLWPPEKQHLLRSDPSTYLEVHEQLRPFTDPHADGFHERPWWCHLSSRDKGLLFYLRTCQPIPNLDLVVDPCNHRFILNYKITKWPVQAFYHYKSPLIRLIDPPTSNSHRAILS